MGNEIISKGEREDEKSFPARIGENFHKELEEIKLGKIKNNTLDIKISTKDITNLIIREINWNKIKDNIINLTKEELDKLWN